MTETESTREKIKIAATAVLVERGYDGARMQEIADRAGANKAMIYYYFSSKDALFEAILTETFSQLFGMFGNIMNVPMTNPRELLPQLVHIHLNFLRENHQLIRLLAREIHSGNPIAEKVIQQLFSQSARPFVDNIGKKIALAGKVGLIRQVNPKQTIWNLVALNLFIFITQPILQTAWPEDFADMDHLLAEREEAIVDLLLYGLLPR
jgi:AcrR family transcriptional regulator